MGLADGPLGLRGAATVLGAGLAGAILAVVGLVVHRMAWRVGGVQLPWGLALGVGTTLACGLAVRLFTAGRAGSVGYATGWLVVVFGVLAGRPEGDYLIASDWLGWSFLLLGGAAVAVPLASALLRPHPDAGPRGGS